ncbi:MAG: hypothetical protein ACE5JG_11370, partial [Planctomycetota bacterium]
MRMLALAAGRFSSHVSHVFGSEYSKSHKGRVIELEDAAAIERAYREGRLLSLDLVELIERSESAAPAAGRA